MAKLKCCIPGCKSTNRTVKLYKFTSQKQVGKAWKTIVKGKFPKIKITQDSTGRCGKYICRLHFEDKYILNDGGRDRFAIPTLFTELEIATKTPQQPISLEHPEVYPDTFVSVRRLLNSGRFDLVDHPYACNSAFVDISLKGFEPDEMPATEDLINEDISETRDSSAIPEQGDKVAIASSDASERSAIEETLNEDGESEMRDFTITLEEEQEDIPPEPGPGQLSPAWQNCDEVCEDDHHYWSEQYIYEPLPFSWQNPEEITSVEDHYWNVVPLKLDVTEENKINDANDGCLNKNHQQYYCDNCKEEIISFRYTCVQCENFDLCRACEGQLVHPHHYMLRVPKPRPFNEIKSILDAIRERIKILTKSGHFDGVEVKEEVDETERQPDATSQEAACEARAWTPMELLADTHIQDPHTHTMDDNDDQQEQNVPDVFSETLEEPEMSISETEEWLDEMPECSDDDELADKTGGSTQRGMVQSPSDPLIPVHESENTDAKQWPPSEHYTNVDPLCIRDEQQTNIQNSDTKRKNIVTELKSSLKHQTSRLDRLSRSKIEFVSCENRDGYNEYVDMDEEIQQALDEIWHSDTFPTAEKTGTKRKPLNVGDYEPKKTKTSHIEKQNLKVYSGTKQPHNVEHEPITKPNPKDNVQPKSITKQKTQNNVGLESGTKPKPPDNMEFKKPGTPENTRLISIIKRNLSDNEVIVSIIKLNLPDNVRLESITEPKPPDKEKSITAPKLAENVETERKPLDSVESLTARYPPERVSFKMKTKPKPPDNERLVSIHKRNNLPDNVRHESITKLNPPMKAKTWNRESFS